MESYTTTTHQSWPSRIGKSFKAILGGILLVLVGLGLLYYNEGRAVNRTKALQEGQGVAVEADSGSVDPATEGKLVHVSGRAESTETLVDTTLGIKAAGLALIREVEMYQWQEEKHTETRTNLGGSTDTVTTYTYRKKWSSAEINSNRFERPSGHANPEMPFREQRFNASVVTLGAHRLSAAQINALSTTESLVLDSKQLEPHAWAKRANLYQDIIYVPRAGDLLPGRDVRQSPQIGDLSIRYLVVPPHEISLVAQQAGDSFTPFQVKHGEVDLLSPGIHTKDAMFKIAHDENRKLTWLLRLVGVVLVWMGISLAFSLIGVLADVIPFFGRLARMGTGLVAALLAVPMSLTMIAIAWLRFRPLLSLGLLAVAVAIILFLRQRAAATDSGDSTAGPTGDERSAVA